MAFNDHLPRDRRPRTILPVGQIDIQMTLVFIERPRLVCRPSLAKFLKRRINGYALHALEPLLAVVIRSPGHLSKPEPRLVARLLTGKMIGPPQADPDRAT